MTTKSDSAPNLIALCRGENGYGVYVNGELKFANRTNQWLDIAVLQALVDNCCSNHPHWINLHAAAVGNSDGNAVILAAASGSGKSTLSTGLALAGYDYLGDDTLMLDLDSHKVIPFPTAANLKPGSWPLYEKQLPELMTSPVFRADIRPVRYGEVPFNVRALGHNYPVNAIVFPRYQAGSEGTLSPLKPTELFQQLNEARLYISPAIATRISHQLIAFARNTPCFSMTFNSTEQVQQLLTNAHLL
jgi:hypothetical protein